MTDRVHAGRRCRVPWVDRLRRMVVRWCGGDMSCAEQGERCVARYLWREGYRVLGRNVHNRFGEIDIVAEAPDRRTIAIVEVKSSAQDRDGLPPEIHVNWRKQRRLVALAG